MRTVCEYGFVYVDEKEKEKNMIVCCLIIRTATKVNSERKKADNEKFIQMYTSARRTFDGIAITRFFVIVVLFVVCHTFIQFICINMIE